MEIAFGILGSIASIIGIFLPAKRFRERITHGVYGLSIIVLSYFAVSYQIKIDRLVSVERIANKMVDDRDFKYTSLGFVHATLAFLEKNRDLYPDTYNRAVKMCSQYKCSLPEADSSKMITLSSTMSGMLTGLATLNDDF